MAEPTLYAPPPLAIAAAALIRAASKIADEADELADRIESGNLPECDGPTALRLFAALVRNCSLTTEGSILVTPTGSC